MKASPTSLLKELLFLDQIVPRKTSLPVLGMVCFDLNGISVTDLDVCITIKKEHDIHALVDISTLIRVIRSVKYLDECSLEMNNGNLRITAGPMTFNIPTEDAMEFPKMYHGSMDHWKPFAKQIDSDVIYNCLDFAGNDELRPIMSGVNIGDHIVATDAHRLVRKDNTSRLEYVNSTSITVPREAAKLFKKKSLINIDITPDGYMAKTEFPGGVSVSWRNIDGKYVNYNSVIPVWSGIEEEATAVSFNTKDLERMVKASLSTSNRTTNQVKFDIGPDGRTEISSSDPDFSNSFRGSIPASFVSEKHMRKPISIGFNAKFLLGILKHIDDTTTEMFMSEPNKAVMINEEYLIMPVMLNN